MFSVTTHSTLNPHINMWVKECLGQIGAFIPCIHTSFPSPQVRGVHLQTGR